MEPAHSLAEVQPWPLSRSGPLPKTLFGADYLERVLLTAGPVYWKCSRRVVRRALRSLARRHGVTLPSFTGDDQTEDVGDCRLVEAVCNEPKTRDRFKSLEALQGGPHSARDPHTGRPLKRPFQAVIWLVDFWGSAESERKHLARWLYSQGDIIEDREGRHLSSNNIERILRSDKLPVALESIDLARAIWLFAAYGTEAEAQGLLSRAAELGCTPIAASISKISSFSELQEQGPLAEVPSSLPATPPKLAAPDGDLPPASLPQQSSVVRDFAGDLQAVRYSHSRHVVEAGRVFAEGLNGLLSMSRLDAEAAVSILKETLSSLDSLRTAEEKVEAFIRSRLSALEKRLGRPVSGSDGDIDKRLVAIDLAWRHVEIFDADEAALSAWTNEQPLPVSLDSLNQLALVKARAENRRAKATMFVGSARKFLAAGRPVVDVVHWLEELTAAEILVLLREIEIKVWAPAAAILVQLGLERREPEYVKELASWLASVPDETCRRRAMRFIDPTSSLMDSSISLRRMIAAEIMRDALAFGPIANITDPSRGLSDEAVVGRSVAAIVALITANLDLFGDPRQRDELFAPRAPVSRSSTELTEFIQTPSTMTGHFRRLRECAREEYMLPLLFGGRLNIHRAAHLAEEIESGGVLRSVVATVERELHGGDRLEGRHVTQLNRYLESTRKLLISAARAERQSRGNHQQEIAENLEILLTQLQQNGPIGTQGWLEVQVKQILTGPGPDERFPTLIGCDSLSSSTWSRDDSSWARAGLDLPEFWSGRPQLLEVCAAALVWWARGKRPSPYEIAHSLHESQQYRAALDVIAEYEEAPGLQELRTRVEATASGRLKGTQDRLQQLRSKFGNEALERSEFYKELGAALKNLNVVEVEERLELLEIDLQEVSARAAEAAAHTQEREAAGRLLRKLLSAGVAGLEQTASFVELERRWSDELSQRRAEREHLEQVAQTLRTLDPALPEFAVVAPVHDAFADLIEDPEYWLPAERSSELSEFLEGWAGKLQTFLSAARFFPPEVRRALASVLRVYVEYVESKTQALRAAADGPDKDVVLEECYQLNDLMERAKDPFDCLEALREAGYSSSSPPSESVLGLRSDLARGPITDPYRSIDDAISSKAWLELVAVCNVARPNLSQQEVVKLDDAAEFGRVMHLLTTRDPSVLDFHQLEAAVRAVINVGHPVQRALPHREQVDVLRLLLLAAVYIEGPERRLWEEMSQLSWEGVFGSGLNFSRSIAEPGRSAGSARLLQEMLSSSLGPDLAERLWSAMARDRDPAGTRADLLRFAHDHRAFEAISRLAHRYDPALKIKIDQMLELRAAATTRPDLVPIAEAVARQIETSAKSVPFRQFVAKLPSAVHSEQGVLNVRLEDDLVLRSASRSGSHEVRIPFTLAPRGIVPEHIQIQLFPEDDVTFAANNGRLMRLSDELMYADTDFSVTIALGTSWAEKLLSDTEAQIRMRISARTVTGDTVQTDATSTFRAFSVPEGSVRKIDNDTILEFYPGVGSTPAQGDAFVGRASELEHLHSHLVGAPHPSPVLLTGMRRIGKTSLLYAFHKRNRQPGTSRALTVYVTIAELRSAFMRPDTTVSSVLFRELVRALGKPNFSFKDHNKLAGERLKSVLGQERNSVRVALEECWDPESFSDSLALMGEKLCDWLGSSRVVFLMDEAESLTIPYNAGGSKKIEVEQLLQSLREVSQASPAVGLLLSGSNHIVEFAREYKNAFFGSCVRLELGGILDLNEARKLIAPSRVVPFVTFEEPAVRYAMDLCGGMPQFMWQLGATVVSQVRGGPAFRADVRSAVSMLVGNSMEDLPFKPYDVLEPIEHMLKLQGRREEDLLWLLLRRVALNSSLTATEASHFLIEQTLLELDSREAWRRRLSQLVELDILNTPRPHSYSFKVPIFAEAFRSVRYQHDQSIRAQRVAL